MSLSARDGDVEGRAPALGDAAPVRAARGLRRVRANGAWAASRVRRADGDGDCANSNCYAYALPYPYPYAYGYAYAATDGDAHRNAPSHCDPDAPANGYPYGDAAPHRDAPADGYPYAHAFTYANPDAQPK